MIHIIDFDNLGTEDILHIDQGEKLKAEEEAELNTGTLFINKLPYLIHVTININTLLTIVWLYL